MLMLLFCKKLMEDYRNKYYPLTLSNPNSATIEFKKLSNSLDSTNGSIYENFESQLILMDIKID